MELFENFKKGLRITRLMGISVITILLYFFWPILAIIASVVVGAGGCGLILISIGILIASIFKPKDDALLFIASLFIVGACLASLGYGGFKLMEHIDYAYQYGLFIPPKDKENHTHFKWAISYKKNKEGKMEDNKMVVKKLRETKGEIDFNREMIEPINIDRIFQDAAQKDYDGTLTVKETVMFGYYRLLSGKHAGSVIIKSPCIKDGKLIYYFASSLIRVNYDQIKDDRCKQVYPEFDETNNQAEIEPQKAL